MSKQTVATKTNYSKKDPYGALSMPVYHCAAFEFDSAQAMADAFCGRVLEPDYSRVMNPTVTFFEDRVKELTDAQNVFAFNSGMAAISNALIAVAQSGSNIVTSNHLFGNTVSLINKTLGRLGVDSKAVNLLDIDAVEAAVDEHTCCIFLEIVTNPQMEVADVAALAEVARKNGIPLIADTTMIPFTEFDAKALGIDVQVVSSTKYISGGATSLGGLIIDYGTFGVFNQRIRFELLFNLGGYMTPHAAYMQTLGLESLHARYAVQSRNTLELAKRLREVPQIVSVNYIGLEDNPFYELAQRQYGKTAGAMLTIDLADRQSCYSFINNLKVVHRATNLFDNKTLAIHPYSTIFGPFSGSQKKAMDVKDTTIRLSIGLEDVDDIFDDIVQALNA
ncbi:MAG: aminotransferase class V-fold PLP-dependent enzyme [Bacteroidaceae bacterium]|nr:aminotransferase class V-fold PLP-dependent enzyme [Bacteroidaceae bacterium]MBQ1676551.1 aminotransferase class V-fold PLP-dependent enzyme [Bacteroidaceae bacterium]MBQ5351668.1 aminotransferase class V-fold PLP-dependent enzyme [Bacteroidaceae bacterium]